MHRINSPRDVVATGVVQVDAGAGVRFAIPTESGGGGGDVTWATLPGKPAVFPSTIGGVDGLTAALAAKADTTHPLLYMSGIRNVTGDLLEGWTGATFGVRLSRQASTVTLALDVNRVGEGSGIIEILPIPAGFRPIVTGFIQPARSPGPSNATGWYERIGTTAPFRLRLDSGNTLSDGQRITNVISWQTVDAIPTTLPGTPA